MAARQRWGFSSSGVTGRSRMSKPSQASLENGNSTNGAASIPSGAAHSRVSHGTLGHMTSMIVTNAIAKSISDTTRLNIIEPMK